MNDAAPGRIVTVTGEIVAGQVGTVLPGEHLISDFAPPHDTPRAWDVGGMRRPEGAGGRQHYEDPLTMDMLGAVSTGAPNRDDRRLDEESVAIAEIADFVEADGTARRRAAIVDTTSIGAGRSPRALRRIAASSGIEIIMGSGWYHPAWTHGLDQRAEQDLAAEIVRDLTVGVDGIRAGVIGEMAPLDPDVPDERRLLRAAASAARATSAPLVLARADDISVQRRVLELLVDEGVETTRVSLAHCDGLADRPDDLLALLEYGVHVQFDQLGRIITVYSDVDDQEVAMTIVDLASRGYADRILISSGVSRKIHLRAYGGSGYAYIPRQFLWLLTHFSGADLITTITEENPRRWLTMPAAEEAA